MSGHQCDDHTNSLGIFPRERGGAGVQCTAFLFELSVIWPHLEKFVGSVCTSRVGFSDGEIAPMFGRLRHFRSAVVGGAPPSGVRVQQPPPVHELRAERAARSAGAAGESPDVGVRSEQPPPVHRVPAEREADSSRARPTPTGPRRTRLNTHIQRSTTVHRVAAE